MVLGKRRTVEQHLAPVTDGLHPVHRKLLNRNRNPQVRRRRRITSATARTMKTLPAIGITQLKNQTPDGLTVAGGASCDVAKSIGASQRASAGADSSTFFVHV